MSPFNHMGQMVTVKNLFDFALLIFYFTATALELHSLNILSMCVTQKPNRPRKKSWMGVVVLLLIKHILVVVLLLLFVCCCFYRLWLQHPSRKAHRKTWWVHVLSCANKWYECSVATFLSARADAKAIYVQRHVRSRTLKHPVAPASI